MTPEEQLADLRAAHDALLHAVSHDLRAPLRHITSFAPLLRESVQALSAGGSSLDAQEAEQFLATIEQASRRLGRMVDALLRIARAGQAPLNLETVDLAALASELAVTPAGRAVEWQWPTGPVPLRASAPLLRQLLAELLDNALKFTQGRAPARIALTVEPLAQAVRWRVQDNGAGFDPARADKPFAVFQRQHRDSEFDGVGGGLALAHTIARRHGAQMAITAQPGQGCVVTLDWPV